MTGLKYGCDLYSVRLILRKYGIYIILNFKYNALISHILSLLNFSLSSQPVFADVVIALLILLPIVILVLVVIPSVIVFLFTKRSEGKGKII